MFTNLALMEEDEFYNDIQRAFAGLPENFSVLEDQIAIEIQMKYFEQVQEIRNETTMDECFVHRNELFSEAVSLDRKKEILVAISGLDNVKAFRTIEKYEKIADSELKDWATLALQESRMLLQSSLLGEQQVFISTGLGGKGKMLRYNVVFINRKQNELLNPTQRKLVKDELAFEIGKNNGEFESMDFMEGFSTALVMLGLQTDIKSVLQNVVDECNQYGNFLKDDMIVTNVKIMSRSDIIQLLNRNNNPEPEEFDEFEEE